LASGASAVTAAPEFGKIGGLRSLVKAGVPPLDERAIPRKFRRSMSRMSIYATLAAQEAWADAGLPPDSTAGPRTGVCIGSTLGSPDTSEKLFEEYVVHKSLERMKSTLFFQIMGHSCAANVAQALGLTGRAVAPSSACSTGCQAVGIAWEFIRAGREERILAGGADELHAMTTATFDIINAASAGYNDRPGQTPRPFDRARDGVVCGEGAGVLLLEELESARRRGARILAEVVGFATVSDPSNIANPNAAAMETCMREALADDGLSPEAVDYINAHATGTEQGDVAECRAIADLFGDRPAVSSLKGNLGHTMAASGALELIATVAMMNRGEAFATRNLEDLDPACAGVRHLRANEKLDIDVALKNSFAMGGINSCLVLRRWKDD
jgi:3-oxoacyl-[acyl-carrier-protein] synthase II